ncbi:MAG: hypothetical protein V4731_16530 [Pseudomonadota bacterium]
MYTKLAPSCLALLAFASLPANFALAQNPPQPQRSTPATVVVAAETAYAIGAQRSGVTNCVPRINQVTSFLTTNAVHSGIVMNSQGAVINQKLVAAVFEAQGQAGGLPSLVSASFAPGPGANECSATYDAITYWPNGCNQVATQGFGGFKPVQPLGKNVFTLEGGPLVKVFLMPAGTGCISVKKEVVF